MLTLTIFDEKIVEDCKTGRMGVNPKLLPKHIAG